MPIRAAVIGTGAITRGAHIPALLTLAERVELVAVADVDADRARTAAEEFGIPAWYHDVDELLAAEAPDLVTVGTPPGAHKLATIRALDAGAWVWCEKPPALSLADYDEIASHEGADGPFASYVFQHRFGSAAERLRRLVRDGTLGRPLVALCNTLWFRPPSYFAAPWRGRWDTEGGGPTMGHGIHQTDLLLSVLGDWSEVTAAMSTLARDTETEDVSLAIVRFASGVVGSITNSLVSPRQASYLRFDFEHATVEVEHLYGYDNSHWRWTPASHVAGPTAEAWLPAATEASSHLAQLRRLLGTIERGERPPASGRDGRRVMELIAGMYKSALTGCAVRRDELTPSDPFTAAMHGGDPAAATAKLDAGRVVREGAHV